MKKYKADTPSMDTAAVLAPAIKKPWRIDPLIAGIVVWIALALSSYFLHPWFRDVFGIFGFALIITYEVLYGGLIVKVIAKRVKRSPK